MELWLKERIGPKTRFSELFSLAEKNGIVDHNVQLRRIINFWEINEMIQKRTDNGKPTYMLRKDFELQGKMLQKHQNVKESLLKFESSIRLSSPENRVRWCLLFLFAISEGSTLAMVDIARVKKWKSFAEQSALENFQEVWSSIKRIQELDRVAFEKALSEFVQVTSNLRKTESIERIASHQTL